MHRISDKPDNLVFLHIQYRYPAVYQIWKLDINKSILIIGQKLPLTILEVVNYE